MLEDEANDGKYICEVWNPVTNITMYTMKDVTFGGFGGTFFLKRFMFFVHTYYNSALFLIGHAVGITVPSRGSLLAMVVFAMSFMLHN